MWIATRRTVKGGDPPRHSIEKVAILERAVQSHSIYNQPVNFASQGLIRQLFHISTTIGARLKDDAVFRRFQCGRSISQTLQVVAVEICKYKYQVINW
jgi:hypothetical protein